MTASPRHVFWEAASAKLEARATPQQKKVGSALVESKVTSEAGFMTCWDMMMPLYFYNWDDTIGGEMVKRGVDDRVAAANTFEHIIPQYDVRDGLPSLSAPTLVCSGLRGWAPPAGECEAIVELIPGAELAMFEMSAHMPFIEEQDRFVDVVRDFLVRTR